MNANDDLRNRVAKIIVPRRLLREDMATVMEGFGCLNILPVGIVDDFFGDSYIYTAYSPMFRALSDDAEAVPNVVISVQQSKDLAKVRSYKVLYAEDLMKLLADGERIPGGSFSVVYKEGKGA